MKPLVSIIVPIYNAASYLQETLDSILASTYRPIEVVMVDDGSKDNSLRIAQDYCANHFECVPFNDETTPRAVDVLLAQLTTSQVWQRPRTTNIWKHRSRFD